MTRARWYALVVVVLLTPCLCIAWQVGHLAMAEYRLALERIRGPQPQDAGLISEEFLRLFDTGIDARRRSRQISQPGRDPGRL